MHRRAADPRRLTPSACAQALVSDPALVNKSAMEDAWFCKLKVGARARVWSPRGASSAT